jgi:hypothetical protein
VTVSIPDDIQGRIRTHREGIIIPVLGEDILKNQEAELARAFLLSQQE